MSSDARTAPPGADLPQLATAEDAEIASVAWVVEPCWKGVRLLARFERGEVTLSDERGLPPDAEVGEAAGPLSRAIRAEQALIDGSWTAMPFVGERTAAHASSDTATGVSGSRGGPDAGAPERRTFVVWDLIELDGQGLHDVPLLERRRLLESVIEENRWVRVTPAVRMPIRGWLGAWRGNGFTHYVAKHINSRYEPGATAPDWLKIAIDPGMAGTIRRFFGGRRTVHRIHD